MNIIIFQILANAQQEFWSKPSAFGLPLGFVIFMCYLIWLNNTQRKQTITETESTDQSENNNTKDIWEAVIADNYAEFSKHLSSLNLINIRSQEGGLSLLAFTNINANQMMAEDLLANGADPTFGHPNCLSVALIFFAPSSLIKKIVNNSDKWDKNYGYIDMAVGTGNQQTIEFLKKEGFVSAADKKFQFAIISGDLDRVKMHMENGADPNTIDDSGCPVFFVACEFGHLNIMQYLLANGADKTVKDRGGANIVETASNTLKILENKTVNWEEFNRTKEEFLSDVRQIREICLNTNN